MREDNEQATEHAREVDAWLARAARGLPPDRLLSLFERALHALWHRACLTLGDVTLMAIVDRVLHDARERSPVLSPLKVDPAGISCRELHETLGTLSRSELEQGMRFVLVEFLTVLGNLTAEILSPALHGELSRVEPEDEGAAQDPRGAHQGSGGERTR